MSASCAGLNESTSCANSTLADELFLSKYGLWMHPHWRQYRDVIDSISEWLFTGLGLYITLVCVVGSIASIAVISVTLSTPALRTLPNLLVVDLAISDMLFALFCGFPMMGVACFRRRWTWSDAGCQWYGFLSAVSGLNSINCLTCIAVDRYLVITRRRTKCRTVLMVGISLAWSLIWATPPLHGWNRYIGEGFMVSCTFDYLTRTPANIAYVYCLFTCQFVIPLLIIIGCYVAIVCAVTRYAAEMSQTTHDDASVSAHEERIRTQKQKLLLQYECQLAKISAGMIGLFIASWLPYAVIAVLAISGLQDHVTPFAAQFPVMLAKSSYVWNPVVYALSHPRYRAILVRCIVSPEPTDETTPADSIVLKPKDESMNQLKLFYGVRPEI